MKAKSENSFFFCKPYICIEHNILYSIAVEAALGSRLCVLPSQRLLEKSKEIGQARLGQALVLGSISVLATKSLRDTVVPRLLEHLKLR